MQTPKLESRPPGAADQAREALERLVQRAQEGDAEAFERLYRTQCGRVHGLCLRLTAHPELAEELTQDVFVRLWERLGTYRGESAFPTWLYRLTANLVIDRLRADRRWRSRFQEGTVLEELPGKNQRPEPNLLMTLEKAVTSLPTGARTVFVLHDIEGYRHGEIASLLRIHEGTSKAQLHRARRLLREVMK